MKKRKLSGTVEWSCDTMSFLQTRVWVVVIACLSLHAPAAANPWTLSNDHECEYTCEQTMNKLRSIICVEFLCVVLK